MIVELLFDVCVTSTLICNNHFDFDSIDLKGRAEVTILDTKYSAVSMHTMQRFVTFDS